MGACTSCYSLKKNNEIFNKSNKDFEKLMIAIFEYKEISSKQIGKDLVFEPENDVIINQMTLNDITNQLKFKLFLDDSETSEDEGYSYEAIKIIPKTNNNSKNHELTTCKRIKTNKNHNDYLENSFYIEDSNFHKIPKKLSFINNPLTLDDVNEIFKNKTTNLSPISPLSVDSSLMTEICNSTEFRDLFDDLYDPNIIVDNEKPIENEYFDEINLKLINYHKIKHGEILNAVPKVYDYLKTYENTKKKEKKSKKLNRGLLNLLYKINKNGQNILHQSVLSHNYKDIIIILECLEELNTLPQLLDAFDKFSNVPLTYAVIEGDVEMVKILLPFSPNIPTMCYCKPNDTCMPFLHVVHNSFLIQGSEELSILIYNYLLSLEKKQKFIDILETKNSGGLTILHYIIVNYHIFHENSKIKHDKVINYILQYLISLGANLKALCPCSYRKEIEVDFLGQIIFSKCPLDILKNIFDFPLIKEMDFKWDYVIDNISYSLDELFLLRTDINSVYKTDVIKLMDIFK